MNLKGRIRSLLKSGEIVMEDALEGAELSGDEADILRTIHDSSSSDESDMAEKKIQMVIDRCLTEKWTETDLESKLSRMKIEFSLTDEEVARSNNNILELGLFEQKISLTKNQSKKARKKNEMGTDEATALRCMDPQNQASSSRDVQANQEMDNEKLKSPMELSCNESKERTSVVIDQGSLLTNNQRKKAQKRASKARKKIEEEMMKNQKNQKADTSSSDEYEGELADMAVSAADSLPLLTTSENIPESASGLPQSAATESNEVANQEMGNDNEKLKSPMELSCNEAKERTSVVIEKLTTSQLRNQKKKRRKLQQASSSTKTTDQKKKKKKKPSSPSPKLPESAPKESNEEAKSSEGPLHSEILKTMHQMKVSQEKGLQRLTHALEMQDRKFEAVVMEIHGKAENVTNTVSSMNSDLTKTVSSMKSDLTKQYNSVQSQLTRTQETVSSISKALNDEISKAQQHRQATSRGSRRLSQTSVLWMLGKLATHCTINSDTPAILALTFELIEGIDPSDNVFLVRARSVLKEVHKMLLSLLLLTLLNTPEPNTQADVIRSMLDSLIVLLSLS